MFSNAKNVEINGKEVKSIILENGAILYEKENPYILSITSDKDILSYYDDESATLTGTITHNEEPVANEEMIFSQMRVLSESGEYSFNFPYLAIDCSQLPTDNTQFIITVDSRHYIIISRHKNTVNISMSLVANGRNESTVNYASSNDTIYITNNQIKWANKVFNWDYVYFQNWTIPEGYELEVKNYNSLNTNSNGQCSVNYSSQGIGDVSINVECRNLQETYVLEDTIYYNSLTSTPNGWTIPSSANVTYSSDGMKLQGSSWTDCYLEIPLTKPYTVEFDLIDYIGITTYIYDSSKSTRYIQMFSTNGNTTVLDTYPNYKNKFSGSIPKGSHVKMEIDESNVKLYVENVLKLTKSYTLPQSTIFGISISANSSTTWKNIKVKPL